MNLNKLTLKMQEALTTSQDNASSLGSAEIHPLHLFSSVISQSDGLAKPLLQSVCENIQDLEDSVNKAINDLPKVSGSEAMPTISSDLAKVLKEADAEKAKMGDEYLSIEHVMLAFCSQNGLVKTILNQSGIDYDKLLVGLSEVRGSQKVDTPDPESKYQALEKYGQDLTRLATKGKIDPVIGRNDEIRRIMQVLSRRTKNNPVLIGEPGTG